MLAPSPPPAEMKKFSGHEKAAALMLALGKEHGAPIWELLSNDEVHELSAAIAQLGRVPSVVVEHLLVQFSGEMSSVASLHGSFETAERLLDGILPDDRVKEIMEDIRGPSGRTMWDKLSNVSENVLATYLKNEYPQTVAVVLTKVKSEHAARVLSMLPESFAMEVVMRMLRMESVQKEALEGVERTLKAEFMSNLARAQRRDAHEMMAEIFNNLDRQSEGRIMAALEERNRDAAERIRALMFTFDDLVRLDGMGVQVLLRNVPKEQLLLALKGASENLRDLFLKNMSERAGKMFKEDLANLGPVRLREVDEAQAAVVVMAKDLAAQGQITLQEGREDEMVY